MLEFIQKYWLEAAFTGVIGIFSFIIKHLYSRLKKEVEEQAFIKKGVLSILYDRLYQACQYHISRNFISIRELDNLKHLYKSYADLGGNGTAEELYKRCLKLKIKNPEET